MPASDPQTLVAEAKCYGCLGVSITDLLKLALWDRISQVSAVGSFIDRANITNSAQIAALNALVLSAHAHGWWEKCDLIYPFVGGNANAHAQNLRSSGFTITWNGAVTHNANGITGDGATGYGNTTYNPVSAGQMTVNSAHLGAYIRTEPGASTRCYVGSSNGTNFINLFNGSVALRVNYSVNDTALQVQVVTALAFTSASRIDSANKHLYSSGVDNSAVRASTSIPGFPLFVLARNVSGAPANIGNANLAGLTAGSGIDFATYQLMATDWQAFQTALGRQV